MKAICTLTLLCCTLTVKAQLQARIFEEKRGRQTILYAANDHYCPVSLYMDVYLKNLRIQGTTEEIFIVIPARTDSLWLCILTPTDTTQESRCQTVQTTVLGDTRRQQYDADYDYDLPFLKGVKSTAIGYEDPIAAQPYYVVDFSLPSGTPVLAAREGVVAYVEQNYAHGCAKPECAGYENYVLVYHHDGTFAEYAHIRFKGATVRVGDRVTKGDVIAYSGSTGLTATAGLRFDCFLPDRGSRRFVMTKFRINKGNKAIYPQGINIYRRNY